MEAKRIQNKIEYEAALEKVASLMSARAGSLKAEALDLWTLLVEEYEARAYPIGLPDPVEAIRFRMEKEGLKHADLAQYLGGKSKVSEVLNRRRPLSLSMIRKLHAGLGIPAAALLREPDGQLSGRYAGIS